MALDLGGHCDTRLWYWKLREGWSLRTSKFRSLEVGRHTTDWISNSFDKQYVSKGGLIRDWFVYLMESEIHPLGAHRKSLTGVTLERPVGFDILVIYMT
jgi:hypothetical protein